MAEYVFEIRHIPGGNVIADYLLRSIEEAGNEIEDEILRTDRFLAEAESHRDSQLAVLRHDNTEYESRLDELRIFLASLDRTGVPIR